MADGDGDTKMADNAARKTTGFEHPIHDIAFIDTNDDGIRIDGGSFKNVCFENCKLSGVLFQNCTLINVTFQECDISEILCSGIHFKNVKFERCTLADCLWSQEEWVDEHCCKQSFVHRAWFNGNDAMKLLKQPVMLAFVKQLEDDKIEKTARMDALVNDAVKTFSTFKEPKTGISDSATAGDSRANSSTLGKVASLRRPMEVDSAFRSDAIQRRRLWRFRTLANRGTEMGVHPDAPLSAPFNVHKQLSSSAQPLHTPGVFVPCNMLGVEPFQVLEHGVDSMHALNSDYMSPSFDILDQPVASVQPLNVPEFFTPPHASNMRPSGMVNTGQGSMQVPNVPSRNPMGNSAHPPGFYPSQAHLPTNARLRTTHFPSNSNVGFIGRYNPPSTAPFNPSVAEFRPTANLSQSIGTSGQPSLTHAIPKSGLTQAVPQTTLFYPDSSSTSEIESYIDWEERMQSQKNRHALRQSLQQPGTMQPNAVAPVQSYAPLPTVLPTRFKITETRGGLSVTQDPKVNRQRFIRGEPVSHLASNADGPLQWGTTSSGYLLIRYLSANLDEATLTGIFEKFGEVKCVNVTLEGASGKNQALGRVRFIDADNVVKACMFMEGISIDGLHVQLSAAGNSEDAFLPMILGGECILYLENIDTSLSKGDLAAECEQFGEVEWVVMPFDRATKKNKGWAFLEFACPAFARSARDAMGGALFNDHPLRITSITIPHKLPPQPEQPHSVNPDDMMKGSNTTTGFASEDLFTPEETHSAITAAGLTVSAANAVDSVPIAKALAPEHKDTSGLHATVESDLEDDASDVVSVKSDEVAANGKDATGASPSSTRCSSQ